MSEPGATSPLPRRREHAAAALHTLVDTTRLDPTADPPAIHRALVTLLLRLVVLRELGDPPAMTWHAVHTRTRDHFTTYHIPLLAPDRLPPLELSDASLAVCHHHLAPLTLGEVHQSLLALRLEPARGRLQLRPADERRRRGTHYTPPTFARDLIHSALRPLLADLGPHPSADAILALRICDPAMGCGAFLQAACDILSEHLARARASPDLVAARRDITTHCLHGVDLDPDAVELARLSLWLHVADPTLAFTSLTNLRHGDSLLGQPAPPIPPSLETRPAFHWTREYPHIFARENPGFDLMIGNPPYFWGNRIGRAFGPAYRDWLQTLHPGAHGNSDLAAHFLRRAFDLLRAGGGLGFITTNSISEAETRTTGLDFLLRHGGTIHHAVRDLAWPGDASVRVATICLGRGPVPGPHTLDGREQPAIASDLRPGHTTRAPLRLPARRDQSFKGVDFGGTGFLLTAAARDELLRLAPDESAFLWPVLNASELLADRPPARHIINFSGHTLAELATRAPHCLDIVRRTVLPRRQVDLRRHRRERWWLYNEACPGLYRSIAALPRVLVGPVVARHHVFTFADPHTVFTNALNIFSFADAAALALLQSRPHELWALRHASSLRCDVRYNPTTCFETYPFPPRWRELSPLRETGEAYHQHRAALMQRRGEGLTRTYNRFHDPDEQAADILELRRLHAALDHAVLAAHGWHDLLPDAQPEFHADPGPRTRLRWPTKLIDEVHARLLAANHASPS